MKDITHTDEKGRNYAAIADDAGEFIIKGPPEGLVDSLGLPEPFATNLHNALHRLGLLDQKTVFQKPHLIQGALQEAYMLDSQRLTEAFFRFEEVTSG